MAILLLVLKIIGIVLLCVMGLVVLILLLLLFTPITYRVTGEYHGKFALSARVKWLIAAVIFGFNLENGERPMYLRIFGFKKTLGGGEGKKDKASKAKKGKKVKGRDNKEDEASADADSDEGAEEDATSDSSTEKNAGKDSAEKSERSVGMENKNASGTEMRREVPEEKSGQKTDQKSQPRKRKRSRKSLAERWKDFVEKIKSRFNSIKTKLVKIKKNIEYYTKLFEREETKRAFNFLWKYLKKLIKFLLPKKLYLKLTFSTGKPDTTGEALGVIAMLPMTYKNKWQVTPDFESEKAYAEADFDVRGHIFLFQIVWIVLRVVLDKDCKRLYNRLRKKDSKGKKRRS